MKKFYFLLILSLLIQNFGFAQGAAHCDGARYLDDTYESTVSYSVRYGENINVFGNNVGLFMDIYEPEGDTQEQRPLVIFAHGGSFIFGSRGNMAATCEEFARKGYVAATIDYRKWDISLGAPDSLQMLDIVVKSNFDMKAAIRYFRQDADTENTYRIDPDMIFAGGLSAGGIMAVNAGIMDETDNIPDFVADVIAANTVDGNFEGTSGNPGYSSAVQGVINWSGGLYRVDWLDADDPPIISMHGTADATVPFMHGLAANIMSINGSGLIHPQAEAMGINHRLIAVEGGGHTDIYTDAVFEEAQSEWQNVGYKFVHNVVCEGLLFVSNDNLLDVQHQVLAFPNPSADVINLELQDLNETYDLFIFDQLGRNIQQQLNTNETSIQLHKGDLGSGVFFVNIFFKDGTIAPVTKRIVFE